MKSAVVGLGQAGCTLSLDQNREEIWSHLHAHKFSKQLELIAGCDTSPDRIQNASEHFPALYMHTNLKEMIECHRIEFLSICTPQKDHLESIRTAVHSGVRYIFCEKPFTSSFKESLEAKSLCERNGISLSINYMRRWDPIYLWLLESLPLIDRIRAIKCRSSTALYTSSSHMLALIAWLFGIPLEVSATLQSDYIRIVHEIPDPGGTVLLKFPNQTICLLNACSKTQYHYCFDISIEGDLGSLSVSDDGRTRELKLFSSTHYSGTNYMTLTEQQLAPLVHGNGRMLKGITELLSGGIQDSVLNAIIVHQIIEGAVLSSKNDGAWIPITSQETKNP